MRNKIILLLLATTLLLSCSKDETTGYSLKSNMMKTETVTVTNYVAGVIQKNATRFECEIIELGLLGVNAVRISLRGTAQNLEALLTYADENAEPESIDPDK